MVGGGHGAANWREEKSAVNMHKAYLLSMAIGRG